MDVLNSRFTNTSLAHEPTRLVLWWGCWCVLRWNVSGTMSKVFKATMNEFQSAQVNNAISKWLVLIFEFEFFGLHICEALGRLSIYVCIPHFVECPASSPVLVHPSAESFLLAWPTVSPVGGSVHICTLWGALPKHFLEQAFVKRCCMESCWQGTYMCLPVSGSRLEQS